MCSAFKATLLWIALYLNLPHDCRTEALLLATESGIKIFDPVTPGLTTVHKHPATAVDFRYNKKDVYFISGDQILYSYYSEYNGSHADPIPIINVTQGSQLDLAVDWKAFKLYYTGGNTGAIYEAALLGSTIAPLHDTSGRTVADIAIDVYDRRYFYIEDNVLHTSPLQGKKASSHSFNFNTDTHLVSSVSKVAVDHHNRTVYVVGYDHKQLQWHLVSTDYNNSYTTLVFNGSELAHPFALGVFDNEVLWGSSSNGQYTIYSCKLTPACYIDHLVTVHQSVEAIHDVKFYNSFIQTPDPDTACKELDCSHNCSVVSRYSVRCSCPPGLSLEASGNICTESVPITTMWMRAAEELLMTLVDELLKWLSSQTSNSLTLLILICCGTMLFLLICDFCLLACVKTPKETIRLGESYNLSEIRYRARAGRESDVAPADHHKSH